MTLEINKNYEIVILHFLLKSERSNDRFHVVPIKEVFLKIKYITIEKNDIIFFFKS